jgi:hypothetical protein
LLDLFPQFWLQLRQFALLIALLRRRAVSHAFRRTVVVCDMLLKSNDFVNLKVT